MRLPSKIKLLSVSLALLVTASCQTGVPALNAAASRAGFKANYLVARTALEGGQYAKASRGYANLLKKAGPLEARLRLEYAHSLLREGKLESASNEARVAVSQLTGTGRSAALAVQATADQEIARQAIDSGTATADAVQRLVSARDAFDEMLKNDPQLDPLGSMKLRRRTIDVELSTIQ